MEPIPLCIDKVIEDRDPYVLTKRTLWEKSWEPGQTVNISFLNGDSKFQERIKENSLEWMEYANLKFKFISSDGLSDIRIAFKWKGDANNWSYIGTDAKVAEPNEPTMNFGYLGDDFRIRPIVLHEFGHALGLLHEFQNPGGGILWNMDAVYKYFMASPFNWTKAQTDDKFFAGYSKAMSNFASFDPSSIMVFRIPSQFTFHDFQINWNKDLSTQDKQIIRIIYPRRQS